MVSAVSGDLSRRQLPRQTQWKCSLPDVRAMTGQVCIVVCGTASGGASPRSKCCPAGPCRHLHLPCRPIQPSSRWPTDRWATSKCCSMFTCPSQSCPSLLPLSCPTTPRTASHSPFLATPPYSQRTRLTVLCGDGHLTVRRAGGLSRTRPSTSSPRPVVANYQRRTTACPCSCATTAADSSQAQNRPWSRAGSSARRLSSLDLIGSTTTRSTLSCSRRRRARRWLHRHLARLHTHHAADVSSDPRRHPRLLRLCPASPQRRTRAAVRSSTRRHGQSRRVGRVCRGICRLPRRTWRDYSVLYDAGQSTDFLIRFERAGAARQASTKVPCEHLRAGRGHATRPLDQGTACECSHSKSRPRHEATDTFLLVGRILW